MPLRPSPAQPGIPWPCTALCSLHTSAGLVWTSELPVLSSEFALGSEQSRAGQGRSGQSRAEKSRAEQSRTEQSRQHLPFAVGCTPRTEQGTRGLAAMITEPHAIRGITEMDCIRAQQQHSPNPPKVRHGLQEQLGTGGGSGHRAWRHSNKSWNLPV